MCPSIRSARVILPGRKPWNGWPPKENRSSFPRGASSIGDVQGAVHAILKINTQLVLLQCNTNYTASLENFDHIHLNVLKTYRLMFPDVVLGLSDHTPGHAAVLGAITLGARMIEKHFTDDKTREGPDHAFAMDPNDWEAMVNEFTPAGTGPGFGG